VRHALDVELPPSGQRQQVPAHPPRQHDAGMYVPALVTPLELLGDED
jgi:hypothetical protein